MMRTFLYFLIFLFYINNNFVRADLWIDEDGDSYVNINNGTLSINSLNSFYYFDQIFTNIRKTNTKVRWCLGENKAGIPKDCTNYMEANYYFYNSGKNRVLSMDVNNFPFLVKAFENYLKSGKTMKVSIDDNDLYAAYILNKNFNLTNASKKILKLSY